jgi:hypothetical protein
MTLSNRIVRYNGYIVRELDAIALQVEGGTPRDKAEASVARAPTVEGNPLAFGSYKNAVIAANRRANIEAMASEPDNGDRFW